VVHGADSWTPGGGWTLVWSDEFEGPQLARTNWTFDLGGGGWGNKELEKYTSAATNVFVANGELVIQAVKTGTNYSSARIKTQGLKSWTFGKIAARMKLPYGQGIWPAFWLLGTNITTVSWPTCGEVDIMEMIGGGAQRDSTIYGTMHWQENGAHASKGSGPHELPNVEPFNQAYHVFEVEWSATNMVWKLDGARYFSAVIDQIAQPGTAAFQKPFFILINLAVGGNWPGTPNASTVFPQQLHVDWVRVYQPEAIESAPPKLEIKRRAGSVILSWPSASGYALEAANILAGNVTPWAIAPEGRTNPASFAAVGPAEFFRLRK